MSVAADLKGRRQRAIRSIVASRPITRQQELVDELRRQGFGVTQATVSRDISELRLVTVPRAGGHVYVAPEDVAPPSAPASDERLRRILADIPISVGRSGLILVLSGTPGSANAVGQAIDESTLDEQEGTLAGDNTLIVLFSDESRLERWLARFRILQALPAVEPSPTPSAVPEVVR
ncbi:MAG: arginine repressor [Chloroflexi bacterium]|nr:arginine repressor [Chloroflexota bacterium]